jgi:hypothetical protein
MRRVEAEAGGSDIVAAEERTRVPSRNVESVFGEANGS